MNLLDECPRMPSAREMLQIVAEDPVAQARYFILSMRLFCEHVLGSGQDAGGGGSSSRARGTGDSAGRCWTGMEGVEGGCGWVHEARHQGRTHYFNLQSAGGGSGVGRQGWGGSGEE